MNIPNKFSINWPMGFWRRSQCEMFTDGGDPNADDVRKKVVATSFMVTVAKNYGSHLGWRMAL